MPYLGRRFRERSGASVEDELCLARVALASTTDSVLMHSEDGTLVLFNEAAAHGMGYTVEEFAELPPFGWSPLVTEEDRQRRLQAIKQPDGHTFVSHVVKPDGTDVYHEVHSKYLETPEGGLVVSVSHNITDKVHAEQLLRDLAYHDPLTGVANRTSFDERFDAILASARRHGDVVGVVFVDVDDFKDINDDYGHEAGDQVLIAAARRLEGAIRAEDLIARMGGDEFVVVVPRLDGEEALEQVAEKLRQAVSAPIQVGNASVRLSASTGTAMFDAAIDDARSVLVRADVAMYTAKRKARNLP